MSIHPRKIRFRFGEFHQALTYQFQTFLMGIIDQSFLEPHVDLYFLMVQSNENDMETLAGLLENGSLKPHISSTFTFENMGDAHLQLESGRTVGKVIVTL